MAKLKYCQIIAILSLMLHQCYSTQVEFAGKEFITVDLTQDQIREEQSRITFRFKTINAFGLIMYCKGTQGDYLAIELVQGSLRYQADLGSTLLTSSKQQMIVGKDLSDNQWHSVNINRNQYRVNISIDGKIESANFDSGSFTRLDLDDKIFIGGIFQDTHVDSSLHLMSRNYIGCLENMAFDDLSILYNAKFNQKNFRTYGDIGYRCREMEYTPVTFPDYKSIIEIPTSIDNSFSLTLSFRTYIPNSMILSKISDDGKIYLEIRDGRLCLRVISPKLTPIKLEIGNNLNDGEWHRAKCTVNRERVSVTLDKTKPLVYKHPALAQVKYNAKIAVLGGGADNILKGFEGCVHDINVDGTFINPGSLLTRYIKGVLLQKCHAVNKCWPNPCANGGICTLAGNDFKCDCSLTLYTGTTCKDPIVQKTCQDYKSLGLHEDSYCHIDPDGVGPVNPFQVLCNMTKDDRAVTVITHDKSTKRIKVDEGSSFQSNRYYQNIIYPLTMDQIIAVIKQSSECKQFVRYECKNSPLLNSPRGPASVSWVDREGLLQHYWGGAPKGSDKCACGVTKTCADTRKYCNCDIGDKFWREDSGFLDDKDGLPVKLIQFDATAENSYFTVGNLECTSQPTTIPMSTTISTTSPPASANNSPLRACRPVSGKPSTTFKPTTEGIDILPQTEKIITRLPTTNPDKAKPVPTLKNNKITQKIKDNLRRDSGKNSTSPAKSIDKRHDGVTISMSILAVIVISASIVLVWAIIAIIVIVKRKKRDSRREQRQEREQDENEEGTEMCILFRHTKREPPRPTIELRRDSYDSYDSVPTPALEYTQQTGFRQPITTHITLDYARAKKKKNGSAYFCS